MENTLIFNTLVRITISYGRIIIVIVVIIIVIIAGFSFQSRRVRVKYDFRLMYTTWNRHSLGPVETDVGFQ